MNDLNSGNFGLLISYVIPGMTALWGLTYPSPTIRTWLHTTAASDPTVGGFLYMTLAAVAAGLLASTVRWLTVDALHAMTGLRRPPFNYARLAQRIAGFDLLVRHHYEYYKFHGNMLVALVFWTIARRVGQADIRQGIDALDLLGVLLIVVLFVASRDNLRNYYQRTCMLLGSLPETPPLRSSPRALPPQVNGALPAVAPTPSQTTPDPC